MSRAVFQNVWGPDENQSRTVEGGLIGWLESTRVRLPLKAIHVSFMVRGCLAEVCVKQIFHQENPRPVDCQYQFPLPADGVVFGCEIRIGDRNLVAQVRERNQAVRLAEQHKEAGHRTLLVESERANLFSMELGNLQFQDVVEVSLHYMQPLRRVGKEWSLEVPLTPGVRYIPGQALARRQWGHGTHPDTTAVADASRVSPIRIDEFHPDAAWFDLEGFLDSDLVQAGTLRSASHGIETEMRGDDTRVVLRRCDEFPDRDWVVRWVEPESERGRSRLWMEDRKGREYGLIELRAPVSAAQQRAEPMDLYFLLDASGSMTGLKWEKAVQAVRAAVGLLGREDRMNLYRFSSQHARCLRVPGGRDTLLESDQYESLLTAMPSGGTELFPALQAVLKDAAVESRGRRHAIVLITDGQVGNEPQVLKWLRERRLPPIHSFGIDLATNDGFLVPLAEISGGSFHSLRPQDDIADIIINTSGVFAAPEVSGLQVSDGWELGAPAIPDVYRGQVRYLSVRRKVGGTIPLALTGRDSSGRTVNIEMEIRRAISELPHLWFYQQRLNSAMSRTDVDEAIACSIAANILCPFTAFVTWDERERVERASTTLIQPSADVANGFVAGLGRNSNSVPTVARLASFAIAKLASFMPSERQSENIPSENPWDRNRKRLVDLSAQLARISPRYSQLATDDLVALFEWLNSVHAETLVKRIHWMAALLETIEKMIAILSTAGESELDQALAPLRLKLQELFQATPNAVRLRLEATFLPR